MKNRHLLDSFKCAFRGVIQTFKSERNFKIHILATIIVMLLAWYMEISSTEYITLVITISIVLISELFNTAIEYTVDLVCGNNYSELGKYAKDIAAGATLVSALGAVVVGCIIFLPKITDIF
jgi:diacylglycerol kinase (ATP)